MGIRHVGVPQAVKFMVLVSHFYRPLVIPFEFYDFIVDLSDEKAEDSNTLPFNIPVLSEYAGA